MTPKQTNLSIVKEHFASHDPKLAAVLESMDISDRKKEKESADHFASLARDIIYQQLHGKAAKTIFDRFETLVGKIEPQAVLDIPDQKLRDVGISWAKVKYVKDLASQTIAGTIDLANLSKLSNDEVIKELLKVKGIGPWTAEMFLIFTLQREDVFSYGDLGLRKGIAKLYGIDNPTVDQIDELISNWSPYKSYGSLALWHHLDT